jgi:phosphatidylserine decarboxylase
MIKANDLSTPKGHRLGGWLPPSHTQVDSWIRRLKAKVAEQPRDLIEPIVELRDIVYSDRALHSTVATMFAEAYLRRKETPLGSPEVRNFEEFLALLNAIMYIAPEYYECPQAANGQAELEPCGLIGFPINALLDWPMGTDAGYEAFSNALVNQQFKKILGHWSKFLVTQDSRYVLVQGDPSATPVVIPWLGERAKKDIVDVACSAVGRGAGCRGDETFQDIFNSDPNDEYYGFQSWDDFFTRTFVDGVRPVSAPDDDDIVVNACESAPFALRRNVALSDSFWLKGQPYSLENMLAWDAYTPQFAGGTVYQAFLSALSFHRWNSPVSGTVKKAYVVNGSYYLENLYEGFKDPRDADAAAPNDSQAFLTAVATRALIFIEADNPKIGLMCVMPVGMAEVSSCEITVSAGDHVQKGDQLGMFHFGGSTHCLIFRPGMELDFHLYGQKPGPNAETNIRVNTAIATVK